MTTDLPPRLAVDAEGYCWRVWPDSWSMARINPDNSPIPEPVTFYVPESAVAAARQETAQRCGQAFYEATGEDHREFFAALARETTPEVGKVPDQTGADYPTVECGLPGCTSRLRKSEFGVPQFCSRSHRDQFDAARETGEQQ